MHGSTTSRWTRAVVAAVAVVPLVACGASRQTVRAGDGAAASSTAASPAPDETTETSTATPTGEAWPLVGGGTLDIGTLSDQPLALWFWAPG